MAKQDNKPQMIKGVTPKGRFKYPNVVDPDYGTDEFPKEHGEYNLRLILSAKEAEAFRTKFQKVFDDAVAQGEDAFAKMPVATRKKLKEVTTNEYLQEIYDDQTEEPTGDYEVRFKTSASGVNKQGKTWEKKLPIFDAKGKPFTPKAVWGGTVGKVSFTAKPYFIAATATAGLSFYLDAVQIIELVEGGSRGADGFGFGEEEGFEADETGYGFDEEEGYEADEADEADEEEEADF